MKRLFLIQFIVLIAHTVFGQNWTIDQCIDTALANNIEVKQSGLNIQMAKENVSSGKYEFLPSINGAVTHGYNWGQSIDPFTNQFATNRVQTNNFYVYGSLVLFSGLQKYYGLNIKSIDYQTEQYNYKVDCRNLKIDISAAYLQVLLNDELLNIAKDQLSLTLNQKERIINLVNAEQDIKSKLNDVLAQEARDNYEILKAQNDLNYSLLLLQQLIAIPYQDSFNIRKLEVFEEGLLSNVDVQTLPEIQSANLGIEKRITELKNNKANLYPKLSLNGSVGSGYSGNNTFESTNGDVLPKPFINQLDENFYQQLYLSLSIPIFNNNKNRSQINLDKLKLEQEYLEKEKLIAEMTNAIQKLKLDLSNYHAQYEAAKTVLEAAKLNFDNSKIEFENDMISFSQHVERKNKLFRAQSDVFQSRYQIAITYMILSYYSD